MMGKSKNNPQPNQIEKQEERGEQTDVCTIYQMLTEYLWMEDVG